VTPKRRNDITDEQQKFIYSVNDARGLAFVATSVEEAMERIQGGA